MAVMGFPEITVLQALQVCCWQVASCTAKVKAGKHKSRPEAACASVRLEGKLERAKGFEPSTPTLARLCSTPELHPLERPFRAAAAAIWPKSLANATGFMVIFDSA
jgi:hypothetical protein